MIITEKQLLLLVDIAQSVLVYVKTGNFSLTLNEEYLPIEVK